MALSQVFFLALLALLGTGFPQQECQSRVVLTSTSELREELANALHGFSGVRNATTANIPTGQMTEQIIARIESRLNANNESRHDSVSQLIEILNAINQSLQNKLDAVNQSIEHRFDAVNRKLDSLERRMDELHGLGLTSCHAASSCSEILETAPATPSGYYWVSNSIGHPHSVYCDMTRSCGGFTGGWMRVAYLDMTNSSQQCPSGLRQRTDSQFHTCAVYSESGGCSSVQYSSHGLQYSKVCGKIKAYYGRSLDGFLNRREHTINSNYVDGVSLTHGVTTRQHIWTFAASHSCPCSQVPSFVDNDYFCDVVRTSTINLQNPLWDGEGCTNTCCRHNNPPWFHRQLPRPTTDAIEMRVCRDQDRSDEDVAIESVEIYIQ